MNVKSRLHGGFTFSNELFLRRRTLPRTPRHKRIGGGACCSYEISTQDVLKTFYALAAAVFFCWKHSRQKTGLPCVGLNGTVVSLPQSEHAVFVSTLL